MAVSRFLLSSGAATIRALAMRLPPSQRGPGTEVEQRHRCGRYDERAEHELGHASHGPVDQQRVDDSSEHDHHHEHGMAKTPQPRPDAQWPAQSGEECRGKGGHMATTPQGRERRRRVEEKRVHDVGRAGHPEPGDMNDDRRDKCCSDPAVQLTPRGIESPGRYPATSRGCSR